MNYVGSCRCKTWGIRVSIAEPLRNLNPRVCDCDYCQAHPSAVISHPDMQIELLGDETRMTSHQNGDRLASFRRCVDCGDLLAVTSEIKGRLRGAVNAFLLEQRAELGPQVAIQPRLLAAAEKLLRWEKLWGEVTIRAARFDALNQPRAAQAFWTGVALERLQKDAEGTFSYNVFSVSREDFGKIQELYRGYFRELRRIVAASEPSECIVLSNVHLFELGGAFKTET